MNTSLTPLSLDQVADHLERMLLRYEELQKSNALLQAQLLEVTQERDTLRSRLASARARVDTLLARMPVGDAAPAASHPAAFVAGAGSGSGLASGGVAASAAGVRSAAGAAAVQAAFGASGNKGPQQQEPAVASTSLQTALTAGSASGKPEPGVAPSSAWGEDKA